MLYPDLFGPGKFARGVMTYLDRFRDDRNTRIVVPVIFDGVLSTTAIVDTGAPWCILDPEEAALLDIERRADCSESPVRLAIRGIMYSGQLCRIPVTLRAEQGESLTIEGTVFIPRLAPDEEWPHPNFLGLDGLLNAIRFAIDPEHNHFFFGPLTLD